MLSLKACIAQYLADGYNKPQATSLAWCDVFEQRMADIEYKYQGNVDGSIRIDCYCSDCGVGQNSLPDMARYFIQKHKGHKTRTTKLR